MAAPRSGWSETVKPDEAAEWNADYRLIAGGRSAIEAAAAEAAGLGWEPQVIEVHATGEARLVAAQHAELAKRIDRRPAPISGGELTVPVSSPGTGDPTLESAPTMGMAPWGRHCI